MKRTLRKLRKTTPDELLVRGSQFVSKFAEKRGMAGCAKLPSDEAFRNLLGINSEGEFLDHFRKRSGPHFFASFENPGLTIAEMKNRWPDSADEILARADQLVGGHFNLLGYTNLNFGKPIDWHLEPVSNKVSPLIHWSELDYLDADQFGDKKIVWELNRHQYFVILGQAYWLSGDERYAAAFASHIRSWMDENPPKLGINWASSLEVAFRSISWLWALHFFRKSSALTPELFLQICKFLYINARHLETYPSTYFSPNTHLTGEALGLFYLGTMLPEFRESARWREVSWRTLLAKLPSHVQPDGVYFEQSSYYHRYTADFYLHLYILLRANETAIPGVLTEKLILLLDHLMYITRPDGLTPLFGDDDGGRLMPLDRRPPKDFRSTLATGAVIFNRADYKFVSGGASEETLWLLGGSELANLDRLTAAEPSQKSMAFPIGGYYVMRDGWNRDSNFLLFDAGPHGADNCGHAHADALSFELAVEGKALVVDPGTYTYTGSKERRDWFRSTVAHNTLTIDDASSSVPDGPFSWKTIAETSVARWISHPRFDYVAAFHDGFTLPVSATHSRSILFLKEDYWVFRDRVATTGPHRIESRIHPDSGYSTFDIRNNEVRWSNMARIQVFPESRGEWMRELGWVSPCYGAMEEAVVLSFSVSVEGPAELVTFILPGSGEEGAAGVREVSATGGRAFAISHKGKHDILLLRGSAGRVESGRFASDAMVAWIRFDREEGGSPLEFLLIEGQALEVDGRALTTGSFPDKFCHVRN